jgi:hypothetical protein
MSWTGHAARPSDGDGDGESKAGALQTSAVGGTTETVSAARVYSLLRLFLQQRIIQQLASLARSRRFSDVDRRTRRTGRGYDRDC